MADFPSNGGAKKAELKVDLRPTLFIGAGGTGMEVMMRIRRRILSAVWNPQHPTRVESIGQFPVARFLHFDLDSGAVIDGGKSQRTDPWYSLVKLSDEERLVEHIDLAQYHESDDSLARFPLIESWMPLRPKKLRSLGIDPTKGAGQIRAIARLYLFDKYPKLRSRIKGALNSLGSNAGAERKEDYQRLGLRVDTSKFRIVVIASCAGGTGAGSAMDLGWIAKAVAREEVSSSQVDLVMFLPSGYAHANKERTEANAYATMMELETAMRDMNAQVRWADPDSLVGKGAPFDDVYFVDTANLSNNATQDIKDVYQMVADSLFEDFASADFANSKRSIAVNQQQHKLGPFNPRVPEQRFGDMRLSYSKVYSAFGQSVLDTQQSLREDIRAYELSALMVKAFFGLLGSDGKAARRAGDAERDVFMREHLAMKEHPFDEFPDFKKGTVDLTPFPEYALTDLLLMDKDERSLLERVESKVQLEIDRIMGAYELNLWREKVAELLPQLERDAIREAGATAETSEDRIKRHTAELLLRLKGRARDQLYALLDDRKQGGLEFVLSLLEQIKARIAQRDLVAVERNAKRYRDIRDALRTRQVEESLSNLGQAAGKLFGRDAQAREVMSHLKRDIADYLRFHMLAVAAGQASEVLNGLSVWLGETKSVDEVGQPVWSGVAGEFQEGRRCVEAMLAALMRHYQLRVYQPKLEVDETGAELPSPSLPHITAKRLHEIWLKRALGMGLASAPAAAPGALERALELLPLWSEQVSDSASDAYRWEVQQAVDKRVIQAPYLIDEAMAAALFSAALPAGVASAAAAVARAPAAGASYKVFLNKVQHGPYSLDEIALRIGRGEIDAGTKVWNMQWIPRVDQWKLAGDMPELAGLFEHAIPDPDDDIPDPE